MRKGTDTAARPQLPLQTVTFGVGKILTIGSGAACELEVACSQSRAARKFSTTLATGTYVVLSQERATAQLPAHRACDVMDEGDLCCILAFVDAAIGSPSAKSDHRGVCVQSVPEDALVSTEALGHWVTLAVMQGNADNPLLDHLRRRESYALAGYLMQTPGDGAHLNELCEVYGLSYSHFRRLCRRSLGNAIKSRLRSWRAARTVLDIIDRKQTILQIAVSNGYTSASHVSTDIKQLFGFTPRMARNAKDLLP